MGVDRLLRRFGFRIHGRPKDGPVTWRDKRTGRVMSQDLAHTLAKRREEEAKAEVKERAGE